MSSTTPEKAVYQNMVEILETELAKLSDLDEKIVHLQNGLEEIGKSFAVSREELEHVYETLKKITSEQSETEKMRTMVSNTFEHLFSQMSQIVNSARKSLLARSPESESMVPAPKQPEVSLPEVSLEEVHETLREVAQTLVEENMETDSMEVGEMETDLGANEDGDEETDMEEVGELLKNISSSYVAGSPE